MQNRPSIIILVSLLVFSLPATAQKLINSPYSRFILGTMEPAGSFRSLGMGGTGTSFRDNSNILFSNPASYSSLDTNSFIFDFGLDYGMNYLSDGTSSFSSDDMNFDHLLLGFPLAKGIGFAAGIIPLSNGYYRMSKDVLEGDPDYDPVTGEYSAYHAGEGGFTRLFLGSGISLTENISAGINMGVLFGQVKRTNQFDFADYYNVFNNNSTENLRLNGISFDYGIQYTKPLKNDYYFNAGVSLSSGHHYKTDYEHISFTYTAYGSRDTISYVTNETSKAFIPGTLSIGISLVKTDKFTASMDFITTKWSDSDIPGAEGYAADTKTFLFGAEFIPDKYSNYSLLRRLEYRIGGHFGDNYLIINGEQVKEYGASFGLGLPMSRSRSKTNLFFDFTRKTGSNLNSLHDENFYLMGVSLNIYDFWFVKKKYD